MEEIISRISIKPYFQTKLGVLYNSDCLILMRDMQDKCVDLVLTDPDYNAKDIGPKKRKYDVCPMQRKNYKKFCKQWFSLVSKKTDKLVFTPGIANTHNYPQPFWQICWHKPAAVSFNRMGGFNVWEPIFIYSGPAKGKRIGQDYILKNTLNFSKGVEKEHPCPKVLSLWLFLINKFSNINELVLDPFLGSGTTAVACEKLGRKWIGIEISEKYCEIATKRIDNEARQGKLF
jgi:DNA modification methylase